MSELKDYIDKEIYDELYKTYEVLHKHFSTINDRENFDKGDYLREVSKIDDYLCNTFDGSRDSFSDMIHQKGKDYYRVDRLFCFGYEDRDLSVLAALKDDNLSVLAKEFAVFEDWSAFEGLTLEDFIKATPGSTSESVLAAIDELNKFREKK